MTPRKSNQFLIRFANKMATIPNIVVQNRWKTLGVFLAFTIFGAAGIPQIVMDQSMDSWFREDDNTIQKYNFLRYAFGSDETLLVMYRPKDGDVFSRQSLEAVAALEAKLNQRRLDPKSALKRITRVRSIVSADYLENRGDQLISRQFVGKRLPNNQAESDQLRAKALKHKKFPGSFFSRDSKLGMILIRTDYGARLEPQKSSPSQKQSDSNSGSESEFDFDTEGSGVRQLEFDQLPKLETVQMDAYDPFMKEIHDVFAEQTWLHIEKGDFESPTPEASTASVLLTGNPYIMNFFNRVIMQEMGLYTMLCIVIIMITLFLTVRSFAAVVWPTLIIFLAIIWTVGIIGWTGLAMTMMINIVVFLVLAAGIASSIHVMSGYRINLASGLDPIPSLVETYRHSGVPIFLAALTTMGGMISLAAVPIVPIRNFAMFAALGVWMAFLGTIFLLPALLSFWAPKVKKRGKAEDNPRLQKFLKTTGDWGANHPKLAVAIFVCLGLIAASGLPRIRVDSNMIEMIKPGMGFREAYVTIDKYFGGTTSVDVIIDTRKQDGVKNSKLVKAMDQFLQETQREDAYFYTRSDSLVDITKESYRNMTDGTERNYRIPSDSKTLAQTLITYDSADPESRRLFVDDNWQMTRMTILSFTKGSYEYVDFVKRLRERMDRFFGELKPEIPEIRYFLTGMMPMMVEMNDFVAHSQIMSFGLALLVICSVLLLMYRSVRFGLMALIPNLFPIVLVSGLLGWSGVPLDSDTLLVVPIAIGIAVDDTIHFLTHYRTALLRGLSRPEAIRDTVREVGQAIVFTSIILSLGFLIFILSSYQAMTNFGVLSSIAILSALFADLILLPALITLVRPFEKGKKKA